MNTPFDIMLEFHGLAMSGGVLDAIERFSAADLAAIQQAYRGAGFEAVAELIDTGRNALAGDDEDLDLDTVEETLDEAYAQAIPDDATLIAAASPQDDDEAGAE